MIIKKEHYIIKNIFKLNFRSHKSIIIAYYHYAIKQIINLGKIHKSLDIDFKKYKIKYEARKYIDKIFEKIEKPKNNIKIMKDRNNNLHNINFIFY